MYELITKHKDSLEEGHTIRRLLDDLQCFIDMNQGMGLRSYQDVLKEYDLEWSPRSIENADSNQLDGRGIMALIVGAVRADRFCEGYLETLIENGKLQEWLSRLEVIDRES